MNDQPSSLPPDRLWQPTTAKWFAVIFGASLLYAIVRYHLAGDVAWSHFPLFILNKATSLAAVMFVVCAYLARSSTVARSRQGLEAGGHQILRPDGVLPGGVGSPCRQGRAGP